MTIILVLFGIIQEQKLIKTFEDNDLLLSNEETILLSNEHIETLDLILVNLGFLPSCKGEYCSILFKNRFQLNCYKEFDILTLSTYVTSYSIKLSKTASSIKNDFFRYPRLQLWMRSSFCQTEPQPLRRLRILQA